MDATEVIANVEGGTVPPEMRVYVNCMVDVRARIGAIRWAVATAVTFEKDHFIPTETVFINLRKILELIAFSSLTANKDKYAAAKANFASHWRANKILEAVEGLNPNFYPVPFSEPELLPSGVKHITPLQDGYLTKDDFAKLYDLTADVLHVWNPFSERERKIQMPYAVDECVARIQRLLRLHFVQLADSETRWLVDIPGTGDVRVVAGVPREIQGQDPAP
jgi:hypothetical protein